MLAVLALAASGQAQTLEMWLPLTNAVPGAGDTIPNNVTGNNFSLTIYAANTTKTPANLMGPAGSGIELLNPNNIALDFSSDLTPSQGTGSPANGSGIAPVLELLNNASLASSLGGGNPVTNFMVTMWLNSVAINNGGNAPRPFTLTAGTTVQDYSGAASTGMQWNNLNSVYWSVLGNTLTATLPSGNFPAETWMFFAFTYDGTTLAMYYGTTNSALIQLTGSGTVTKAGLKLNLGTAASIDIGNNQAKTYDRGFNGWISDVRFYNGVAGTAAQNLTFLQTVQYQQLLLPTVLSIVGPPSSTPPSPVNAGASVTLSLSRSQIVGGSGNGTYTYQWQTDGGSGLTPTNIPGATGNSVNISTASTTVGTYSYDVVVTDSTGASITSTVLPLIIRQVISGTFTDITNAPDAGGFDIYQYSVQAEGYTAGQFNNYDDSTVAQGGRVGESFTTGADPQGYAMSGVAIMVGNNYPYNTGTEVPQPYDLDIYQISADGTTATWVADVTNLDATFSAGPNAPGVNQTGNIWYPDWIQWTFPAITLQPNTVYAWTFHKQDSDALNSYVNLNTDTGTTDLYPGGQLVAIQENGGTVTYSTATTADDVFDINLTPLGVPPAAPVPVILATTPNTAGGNSVTVLDGTTVTLTATYAGSGLSFQWMSDNNYNGLGTYTNINNNAQFSGATTATLVISNFNVADGADYAVVVSNASGSATNDGNGTDLPPITLTANQDYPSINFLGTDGATNPPVSPLPVPAYGTINLNLSVSAQYALTYQWESDAGNPGVYTPLANGAGFSGVNTTNLTITGFVTNDAADYQVVLGNGNGTSTGSPLTLQVSTNLLFNGNFVLPAPAANKITTGYATVTGWTNTGSTYANTGVENTDNPPGGGQWDAFMKAGDGGAYQMTGYQMKQGDTFTLTWYAEGTSNSTTSATFTGNGPLDPNQTVTLVKGAAANTLYAGTTALAVQTNGLPGGAGWIQYTLTYTALAADAGNYIGTTFITKNNSGTVNSSAAALADFVLTLTPAGAPPSFVSIAPAPNPLLGTTTDLSVVASGASLTYQWQSDAGQTGTYTNLTNGNLFSGVNTATLVISNITLLEQADYVCIVRNPSGAITNDGVGADSPPITIYVNTSGPTLATAPVSAAETLGWPATLTAAGTDALTYQWQACATNSTAYTNLATGTIYTGVNSPTLTIANFNSNNVGNYVVVVINEEGTVTNDGVNGDAAPATLTLSTNLLFNAQFVLPGTGKILTGFASVPGWSDTSPAAGYNNTGVQPIDNPAPSDPFFASAWEGYCQANGQGGAYQVSYYPINYGDTLTFTWYADEEYYGDGANSVQQNVGIAVAASPGAAYSALSRVSITTNLINGAYTEYTLVYNSQPADVGKYPGVYFYTTTSPTVATPSGNDWSGFDDMYLTVAGAGAPPTLVSTSPNPTVYWGGTADLSVTAGGTGLGYQWLTDGGSGVFTNINNGGVFSGATSATLVITGVQPANAGNFECVVTNAAGAVTNDGAGTDLAPIQLTVQTAAPVMNTVAPTPSPIAEYPGFNITLSETDTGGVAYQWYSDYGNPGVYTALANGAAFSGVTTANLVINSFGAAEAADYEIAVSNGAGAVTNDGLNGDLAPITLTLNSTLPAITTAPVSKAETLDWPATLTVASTGAFTYQWYSDAGHPGVYSPLVNGSVFSGVSTNTLTISSFTTNQAADYEVVLANSNGSVTNDGLGAGPLPATLTLSSNLLYNAQFNLQGTAKIATGYAKVPGWSDTAPAAGYTDTGVQGGGGGITDPYFNSTMEAYTEANGQGGAYQVTYYPIQSGDTLTLTWWANQEYQFDATVLQDVGIVTGASQGVSYAAVNPVLATNLVVAGGGYKEFTMVYQTQPVDVGQYPGVYFYNTVSPTITAPGGNDWTGFDDFYLTVQHQPTSEPTPVLSWSGNNLVITLPTGILLQSTNLLGPWTTNTGTSPYTIPVTNSQMFFRGEAP
jgi:hypothetical protein